MRLFTAPQTFYIEPTHKRVFLAGSIEMGEAEDWQETLIAALADCDVDILNPRRDDWDSSWVQAIDNPHFFEQVNWELDALEAADIIALVLSPGTKSPISLLEYGLYVRSGKLIVCCPEGFWRKGNVDIVCRRYGVSQVGSMPELVEAIREKLKLRTSDNCP